MICGTCVGRIAIEPRISEVNKIKHLYIVVYTRDAGKKFYVSGSLWGSRAENIFPHLRIDQPVAISGRFQAAEAYEDVKSGETKTRMVMILTDIELLDATLAEDYDAKGTKARKSVG